MYRYRSMDLTNGSTATSGNEAQQVQNGTHLMGGGDVWRDEMRMYTGADNYRAPSSPSWEARYPPVHCGESPCRM
jgi:hypothetical protein